MRLLFINQYYAPDHAASAQLCGDLCEDLARRGHEVHVVAGRSLYDGRALRLASEEMVQGVHVHRVGATGARPERLRHRLARSASFLLLALGRAHRVPRPDVVVTLTTPPVLSLVGCWLRAARGARSVQWVMDIYPDIAVRAHVISPWGPVRVLMSGMGRVCRGTASRVVVLGGDMRDVLVAKGAAPGKIEVIPCWAGGGEIAPRDREANAFARKHLRPGVFTLMYSGNMGLCHTFSDVVEGIGLLGEEGFEADFLFVGGGKRLAEVREALEGRRNVAFLPYQDRQVLGESLTAPDAHLVTLDPRFDGLMVPSKLHAVMAAGKPVLFVGSERNEVARVIQAARCGLVVAPHDARGFAGAVRQLATSPEEREAMGRRARQYFEEHFERERVIDRFARLLEEEGGRARR
jgi:glycosyltransferase involved in cell wall biosynthesis